MNINEQLEQFLSGLGVEMERNTPEQHNPFDNTSIPEVSIFQPHAMITAFFIAWIWLTPCLSCALWYLSNTARSKWKCTLCV